jgi:general L-amino acid transport system permease protein
MIKLLRNQRIRGYFFQILTIMALVAFLLYIGTNTVHNIEQGGIKTGFDFLSGTAGFAIDDTPITFSSTHTHLRVFYVGLLNTLIISAVGIVLTTIIGLLIGILRLSRNWLISKLASIYIDIFRNIPPLLQILFWYNVVLRAMPSPKQSLSYFDSIFINNRGLYIPMASLNQTTIFVMISIAISILSIIFLNIWANKRQEKTGEIFPVFKVALLILILVPMITFFLSGADFGLQYPALKGFNFSGGKSISPEFLALTFALVIYTSTFIAEAIRSGIQAVSKGQKEASLSLGLSPYQSLKLVILPQAIRIAIPPAINNYLNFIKNTSLATAIGYSEIVTVFAGISLNITGQAIEIIAITMLVYLIISLLVSLFLNWFNHKMKIKER